MIIRNLLYEEIEDYNAYDFYLMKKSCTCEKQFKTIGVQRGMKDTQKLLGQFKQTVPTKNIHPKQAVILYCEE